MDAQITVSILIRKIFKNIILLAKADYTSSDFASTGFMRKPKKTVLEDLFLVCSLLSY